MPAHAAIFFLTGRAHAGALAGSDVVPAPGPAAALGLCPAVAALHFALFTDGAGAVRGGVALGPGAHHTLLYAFAASALALALGGDTDGRIGVVAVAASEDAVVIGVVRRIDAFSRLAPQVTGTGIGAVRPAFIRIFAPGEAVFAAFAGCRASRRGAGLPAAARRGHARNDGQVVHSADDLTTEQDTGKQEPRSHSAAARGNGSATPTLLVRHVFSMKRQTRPGETRTEPSAPSLRAAAS